jgi:hypothetical protein
MKFRFLEADGRHRVLGAHCSQIASSRAAGQPNRVFENWSATKRPLVTSPNRPTAVSGGANKTARLSGRYQVQKCHLEIVVAVANPVMEYHAIIVKPSFGSGFHGR